MAYEKNGDWGRYEITEAKTGWVIKSWSRRQGDINGRKILIPYGSFGFQKGLNLSEDYNGWMTNGEALRGMSNDSPDMVKVLRKGEQVF